MRKTLRRLTPVALLLLAVLACGCDEEPKPSVPTFSDAKTPITVQPGETFRIELPGAPSTGFVWTVTSSPDEEVIKLIRDVFVANPDAEGRVGAGGDHRYTLRAVAPGETSITLTYTRPWETDTPPAREETFMIRVH